MGAYLENGVTVGSWRAARNQRPTAAQPVEVVNGGRPVPSIPPEENPSSSIVLECIHTTSNIKDILECFFPVTFVLFVFSCMYFCSVFYVFFSFLSFLC